MSVISARELEGVLLKAGFNAINKIQSNIRRNNQVASGRALNSIRQEASSDVNSTSLDIIGVDYIENIETGVSPSQAKIISADTMTRKLYSWSFDRGLQFQKKSERWRFSANTTRKLQSIGSMLYRNGGRTDVFTSEVQPLINEIEQQVANTIITAKILP